MIEFINNVDEPDVIHDTGLYFAIIGIYIKLYLDLEVYKHLSIATRDNDIETVAGFYEWERGNKPILNFKIKREFEGKQQETKF